MGEHGADRREVVRRLAAHRESIDRLDAVLVYTLAERFNQTRAVGRLKAEHDMAPADPGREAKQIARLERLAGEADLDPDFARKFLQFIITEVIKHHDRERGDADAAADTQQGDDQWQ